MRLSASTMPTMSPVHICSAVLSWRGLFLTGWWSTETLIRGSSAAIRSAIAMVGRSSWPTEMMTSNFLCRCASSASTVARMTDSGSSRHGRIRLNV